MSDLNVNHSSSDLNEYTLSPQEEIRINKENEEDLARNIAIFKNLNSTEAATLYQELIKMSPSNKEIIDKAYTEATGLAPPETIDSSVIGTTNAEKSEIEKNPFGLK